jgi:hypothetical protein
MIFFLLLLIAIYLYFKEKYVASVWLLFFFLTNGFQIVPLEFFQTPVGISKSMDFALIYVVILSLYEIFKFPKILFKNKITKAIFLFLGFIVISIFVSRFLRNTPWIEIIRTSRFFFIILAYFLFIKLPVQKIDKIFRILFIIVFFQSVLFVLQVLLDEVILTGYIGGSDMEGISFKRYYNAPYLLPYFVFYALFKNPYKGNKKYFSIGIAVLTAILPMHRGWIITLSLISLLGAYFCYGYKGIAKYLFIGLLCFVPLSGIILPRFEGGKTVSDVNLVLSGAYKNYYAIEDATLLFRVAHFYERLQYVIDEPVSFLFGVGYMTEDSPFIYRTLDFQVGAMTDDGVVQLDTADISWSLLITRFGVVGTTIYLIFFFVLVSFFWKRRKIRPYTPPLIYLLYLFVISVNNVEFFNAYIFAPIVFLNVIQAKKIESQRI